MGYFTTSEQLYDVFTGFMKDMAADPVLGPKFVKSKTAFRINYTDPDASILVDCTHDPIQITEGASDSKPDVELTMKADNGHLFWMGKLKITTAITKRKVKVNGQVAKMMNLLPALDPAFARYRSYLAEKGYNDLLAVS
ncbi:MAG: SCP2 sterol-binding domain-containing protein [Mycobacterium sp.]|uniref:SCP2 sterol-binding domain-containing protein n=1 Tax=Mycobacterium sp. TaxID=1785 RepID=UPI003C3C3072